MHDKMNDEKSKEELINNLNDYFDISSLNIDDLTKTISDCNLDNIE